MAQLFEGHDLKNVWRNFTKLHTTFTQHVKNKQTNVKITAVENCVSKNPILWIPAAILNVYGRHARNLHDILL